MMTGRATTRSMARNASRLGHTTTSLAKSMPEWEARVKAVSTETRRAKDCSTRNAAKSLWFRFPMVFPTHGQKWSNRATHLLITEQCFAPRGRTSLQVTHREPQLPAHRVGMSSLAAAPAPGRGSIRVSRPPVRMPGSRVAVRYMK